MADPPRAGRANFDIASAAYLADVETRLDDLEDGGGGGAPTGPAGGVLSGTYPDPGFAADMATQAGLAAEEAARSTADALLIPLTQKGTASGVATLDGAGLVPAAQIPAIALTEPFVVATQAAMLALSAQRGDVAIRTDLNKTFILATDAPGTLADWKELLTPTDAVSSVNGRTGPVTGLAEQSGLDTESAARIAGDAASVQRANHTGTQTASTISDFDTQVRTSRLDQMAAPTTALALNGQKATGLAAATANGDAVRFEQLPASDAAAGTASLRTLGTGATQAAAGNDSRFTQVSSDTHVGSYVLVLADAGRLQEMDVASANTLTVPPNSSVAFPVGTVIPFRQYGAGQVTLTPGAGVTIRSAGSKLKTAAQYSEGALTKRATDEWVASGDLSA